MKKILLSALCFAGILMFGSSISAHAAPILIKASTTAPIGGITANGFHEFADAINERSNGRFKMEVYDNGKLGSSATVIQAMQVGTVQMVLDSTAQLTGFAPMLNFYDTPYLVPNFDEAAIKVMNGATTKKILEKASTKRLLFLNIMSAYPRYIETSRPVHSLEDAKGLKIRTTPSKMHLAIMNSFGMAPIPMTSSEVVTSLQQGVIEGVDYGLNPSIVMGFDTIVPYWSKFDHGFIVTPLSVNRKWWEEKLTEEDRQFILTLLDEFTDKIMHDELNGDKENLEMLEKKNTPVFIPSKEEKARWIEASKDVHKGFPKDFDPQLVDEFRAEYAALTNK